MADSLFKKENNKKKIQKQQEKALRREERKTQNNKGKSLEEMFSYVDAYGNITDTKPTEKLEVDASEIDILPPTVEENPLKTGVISFLSEKGYGFITESESKENLFFHQTNCSGTISKGNKVSFNKEKTSRGYSAINIQIIK